MNKSFTVRELINLLQAVDGDLFVGITESGTNLKFQELPTQFFPSPFGDKTMGESKIKPVRAINIPEGLRKMIEDNFASKIFIRNRDH